MKKIQILFDPAMLRAADVGGSIASTVRDALRFYEWCRKATSEGWTICALHGETRREPMLRFDARLNDTQPSRTA